MSYTYFSGPYRHLSSVVPPPCNYYNAHVQYITKCKRKPTIASKCFNPHAHITTPCCWVKPQSHSCDGGLNWVFHHWQPVIICIEDLSIDKAQRQAFFINNNKIKKITCLSESNKSGIVWHGLSPNKYIPDYATCR